MIEINGNTTKIMLDNSESDFLIHKGTFDRISEILKNKRIRGLKYTSFSDGMPQYPAHGDSVIVFDKKKLIKKGYSFLKIEYDSDFLDKNKEILGHIMQHKTLDEWKADLDIPINEDDSRVMNHLLNNFSNEKEIISTTPVDFEVGDVLYVISNSLMKLYYPLPEEYDTKFILFENFCEPYTNIKIPSDSIIYLNTLIKSGFNNDFWRAFHLIYALITNPELKDEINDKSLVLNIPLKWEPILSNMHNYSNNDSKHEVIEYILRVYILNQKIPDMIEEDRLLSQITIQSTSSHPNTSN